MSAEREWESLLARMEEDAERVLATDAGAEDAPGVREWTTPAAPLPEALADRARRVVARQRAAMDRLRAARAVTRDHLDAVRRVPGGGRPETPAYLDVNG